MELHGRFSLALHGEAHSRHKICASNASNSGWFASRNDSFKFQPMSAVNIQLKKNFQATQKIGGSKYVTKLKALIDEARACDFEYNIRMLV